MGVPSALTPEAMGSSSSSCSTDRSQRVTWSSEPEAANTDVSVGCHSTDVMGALCHEKSATGVGVLTVSSDHGLRGKRQGARIHKRD